MEHSAKACETTKSLPVPAFLKMLPTLFSFHSQAPSSTIFIIRRIPPGNDSRANKFYCWKQVLILCVMVHKTVFARVWRRTNLSLKETTGKSIFKYVCIYVLYTQGIKLSSRTEDLFYIILPFICCSIPFCVFLLHCSSVVIATFSFPVRNIYALNVMCSDS